MTPAKVQTIKCTRTASGKDVALVDHLPPHEVVNLVVTGGFEHLVQVSLSDTMREIRVARIMAQKPQQFLEYPISSSLNPRAAGAESEKTLTLKEWALKCIACKAVILDELAALCDSVHLSPALRDDVVLAADEFCCNVLFSAVNPDGVNPHALSKALANAEEVLEKPAKLRVGMRNGILALTCWDAYGSLNPARVLERLRLCLTLGAGNAMNLKDEGTAGIGSFLVFNVCSSLYMVVEKDHGTLVCALFPTDERQKQRVTRPKHLHWTLF